MPGSNRELGDSAARLVGAKAEKSNALGLQRIREYYVRAQSYNALVYGEKTDVQFHPIATSLGRGSRQN